MTKKKSKNKTFGDLRVEQIERDEIIVRDKYTFEKVYKGKIDKWLKNG